MDDPLGHGQTFMTDFFGMAFSCELVSLKIHQRCLAGSKMRPAGIIVLIGVVLRIL